MPVALAPSSAAGLLALLDEPDAELQRFALEQLDAVSAEFWPEISERLVDIETLSESSSLPLPTRQLASLLLAKLYFHLSSPSDALTSALSSGPAFSSLRDAVVNSSAASSGRSNPNQGFVEVVTAMAIDTYVSLRATEVPRPAAKEKAPVGMTTSSSTVEALEAILQSIIDQSLEAPSPSTSSSAASGGATSAGAIHALGLALDARRADLVQYVWERTGKDAGVLRWVLEMVGSGAKGEGGRRFRTEVLELLLDLIPLSSTTSNPSTSTSSTPSIDYPSLIQVHLYLARPDLSAALLTSLLADGQADARKLAWAYQVGFDLAEGATQGYLVEVAKGVFAEGAADEDAARQNMRKILSGETSIRLYLDFLKRADKKDLLILQTTKDALESRSSMYHSALTLSHAFMSSGTTSDAFLRSNLDFLSRAANWSKFTATAALGVINKGSLSRGRSLLGPYLPGGGQGQGQGKEYSEGGALFAVGLVNAGRGGEEGEWLKEELVKAEDEVVKHGAALGLGVAGMASGSEDLYDALRETLFQDSAIAGEASGYAMGLVLLGSNSDRAFDEMVQYAHETQHEKIVRGLAVGMAFLAFGKEEEAEPFIERLVKEKDAILRYGGMYTIALAYAGTANNGAIRRLLDVAVSDVSDDVRRAAVTALGFVLCRSPGQVPRIVQLLSESYNPHVRQGAAVALGVACAGTGLEEAVELLEPMTKDPVDFVRQGALMSLAMVLIQQSSAQTPAVTAARTKFAAVIADKHEDSMAKFGACLAQGILDAGGRNVTVSLVGRNGMTSLNAVVGMALFCQFWYWFPLAHCLSLGFAPTALIGLDKDLKIPKFDFVSKAKPSVFAYPPALKVKEKEEVKAVAAAVLSTTAKANARAQEKKKEKDGGEAMDLDDKNEAKPTDEKMDEDATESTALLSSTDKPAEGAAAKKEGEPAHAAAPEPSSETLPNMSRVTPAQAAVVSFPPSSRYLPIRADAGPTTSSSRKPTATKGGIGRGAGVAGIVIVAPNESLAKTGFEEEQEFIELDKSLDAPPPVAVAADGAAPAAGADVDMAAPSSAAATAADDGPERDPPASFEYPFDS